MSEEFARAPLVSHLAELKRRLIASIFAWLLLSLVAFHFSGEIFGFLTEPLAKASGETERRLIYTGLTESFITYIKIALLSGLMGAFPFMAYQLYRFVAPGLYAREKKHFRPFLLAAPCLFACGAAFAYYGVMPLAWGFFLSFEQPGATATSTLPLVLEARISEYISLCVQLITAFGLAFQLPVLLVLLVKSGVMKVEFLIRSRRYAVVILLILAAIITPPDVISQLMLFSPLYLLYELSIWIAKGTGD